MGINYSEFDPKVQEIRIAFEKAVSAHKKRLFIDAFNEFNERFAELKELFKRKNLKLEDIYRYFPEVGYMERSVMERYRVWEKEA
jgi:hypothetical protein